MATSEAKKTKLTSFSIPLPDDWHHHFRDSKAKGDGRLETVAPIAAEKFGRMIAMPNLVPPVTTTSQALEYRERILSCVSKEAQERGFEPLMTLYLTDSTKPEEMDALKASEGKVVACKLCTFDLNDELSCSNDPRQTRKERRPTHITE